MPSQMVSLEASSLVVRGMMGVSEGRLGMPPEAHASGREEMWVKRRVRKAHSAP